MDNILYSVACYYRGEYFGESMVKLADIHEADRDAFLNGMQIHYCFGVSIKRV